MHYERYVKRGPVWKMDRTIVRRLNNIEEDIQVLEVDNAILKAQIRSIKDSLTQVRHQLDEIQSCVDVD